MARAALPIFFSLPFPTVTGITIYSINLARALARLGHDARILLTESDTLLATYRERTLEIPADVAVERLPVARLDGWGAHWGALIHFLNRRAPCVYVPNSDYRHSVVSPALDPGVVVVGVAHADEPLHYDHVARLGRYWNAVVCVSAEVAARVRERHPELAARVRLIRNGIEVPAAYPEGRPADGPLRLVYHGAFKQQQKRVLDFPALLRHVRDAGVDAHLTLIGSGPDEEALRERGRELVAEGALAIEKPLPNDALRAHLARFHAYVLNSEFEGMPQALLEAMAQGCVPVVTDVSSGTREVVREGENGHLVGVGDFAAFAERLGGLHGDRERLGRMSRRAHETMGSLGLRLEDMARAYHDLFAELRAEVAAGGFARAPGPIAAPPVVVGGLSVFPTPLRARHAHHGRFPSWGDVGDFEWERMPERGALVERQRAHPLLIAVRDLGASYLSELAVDLASILRAEGYDTRLACLRRSPAHGLVPPPGVPAAVACPREDLGWAGAAARMLRLVAAHGRCTYVALDRATACLAPRLGPGVRSVVLLNKHDVPWAAAGGLREHADGFVFTSPVADALAFPDGPSTLSSVAVIPFPLPAVPEPARAEDGTLEVFAYYGHLDGALAGVEVARASLAALAASGARARVTLAVPGDGRAWGEAVLAGLPPALPARPAVVFGRRDLRPHLEAAHVVMVPVPLADISLLILEALVRGCVPVGVRSPGLMESLSDDLAADLPPEGDHATLAGQVAVLAASPERLRERARAARRIGLEYCPDLSDVRDRWIRLLGRVWAAREDGNDRRRPGGVFPPYPELRRATGNGGPVRIFRAGSFSHWHEWLEFQTAGGAPYRVARALARWARAGVDRVGGLGRGAAG
ncbi:MAG TPA: glycosyltransferase family 4 protein [Vicinamibacteria bacterium]